MNNWNKYRLPYYRLGKVQMLIGNQNEALKRFILYYLHYL